ncbi:MAG: thiol:disulfide interchange protein DsbA/DsbL [Gammaproteobacteria bacterium]|jgi:protein dithiol oxidoreductase (disulfide-forming)|nr:thiol:disulfide interchange protein DsbA/DsbL [Gammaproteobacteria bacterium]
MKNTIWVAILVTFTLLIVGCSKEETVETPAVDTAITTGEQTNDGASEVTESDIAKTESLEVVEESAAEAEPEDKAIVLARTDNAATAAPRSWKYKEGRNFTRLIPTQPTVGGADKIEVAEIFMYSCPHCLTLEPHINAWAENKDPSIRFVRIPAIFNQLAQIHAQLYYTEVFLAKTGQLKNPGAFRQMVFEEYHNRGNRLTSQRTIERLFVRAGVSADDFNRTWNSFEVDQALRVAQDLARRYNVASVPMVVVNGKYHTNVSTAGGIPQLLELVDELTEREGLRY